MAHRAFTCFAQPRSRVVVPSVASTAIDRPRVRAQIAEVVDGHQVTLVVAPAGYGKTGALADWALHQSRPVAWLTIDQFDNDLARLHCGVLESFRVAMSRWSGPSLATDGTPVLEGLRTPGLGDQTTPGYFDALLGTLDDLDSEIVLVLDDAHELHGRDSTGALSTFARQLPPNVRLVISARHSPALPLQRLRAAGQLGDVREDDLAFDQQEVRRLAEPVDDEAKEALYRLTGGWPVAVRLMLLAMTSPVHPISLDTAVEAATPLADYLVEEVLRGLPHDMRRFVLRATSTRTIDPGLADYLWPDGDGPALLDRCQRRGLFLLPDGSQDGVPSYRWNMLFAAVCQAVLRATRPDEYRAAHRTLALNLASNDIAAAIEHATAADDGELAAALLHDRWAELWIRGEHATVRELLRRIPAPWSDGAELVVAAAAVAAVDHEPAAFDLLERSRRLAAGLPEKRGRVVERTATLVELFVASPGLDMQSALRRGTELLEHADEMAPSDRTLAYFLVGRAEAFAYDDQQALNHLAEGARLAAQHGFPGIELACLAGSTVPLYASGDLDGAWALADEVVTRVRNHGWESPSLVAKPLVAKGLVCYSRNQLDEARNVLEQGLRMLPDREHAARVRAAGGLMLTCVALNDPAGFARARARALEVEPGETVPAFAVDTTAAIGALAHSVVGDVERAVAQIEGIGSTDGLPDAQIWEAEVYRRAGRQTDAQAALDRIPEAMRHSLIQVDYEVIAALLARSWGETENAHLHLERALDAAAAQGIVRPFAERPDATTLLGEHLGWGTRHETFVVDLVHQPVEVHTAWRSPVHWELSSREREVLLYMRSPLSAAEIAQNLFVSVNTVKTHQRSIYRKLGVTGRPGALRAAAERGLLV